MDDSQPLKEVTQEKKRAAAILIVVLFCVHPEVFGNVNYFRTFFNCVLPSHLY